MAETVNLPRDSTLRELVAVQKASIIASGNTAAIDRFMAALFARPKALRKSTHSSWTGGTSAGRRA